MKFLKGDFPKPLLGVVVVGNMIQQDTRFKAFVASLQGQRKTSGCAGVRDGFKPCHGVEGVRFESQRRDRAIVSSITGARFDSSFLGTGRRAFETIMGMRQRQQQTCSEENSQEQPRRNHSSIQPCQTCWLLATEKMSDPSWRNSATEHIS